MTELARTVRSGVVEAHHDGAAIAVSADGSTIAHWGDPTEHVFFRSAIKPFQATISQRNGAALIPEQMALACASHSGHPVQLELVRGMLESAGLTDNDLGCPPALPLAHEARMALAARGESEPRRLFHTCSGKHSGFLRACLARGWPTRSYLDPDHPLQRETFTLLGDVTGAKSTPVGVDGCGAPAPLGTLSGLARAFAVLTVNPEFEDATTAMSRYPSLLSGNLSDDGRLAAWWGGPMKRGAMGIIAAARHGVGIAVKSREGSSRIALVGLIAVMRELEMLSDAALSALEDISSPPVLGGGRQVGALEPTLGA
jgi:L-asparaginase II